MHGRCKQHRKHTNSDLEVYTKKDRKKNSKHKTSFYHFLSTFPMASPPSSLRPSPLLCGSTHTTHQIITTSRALMPVDWCESFTRPSQSLRAAGPTCR